MTKLCVFSYMLRVIGTLEKDCQSIIATKSQSTKMTCEVVAR
jgi:hypothetical protein